MAPDYRASVASVSCRSGSFERLSLPHCIRFAPLSLLKSLSGLGVGLAMKIATDGF
jgi:hypothetical protein